MSIDKPLPDYPSGSQNNLGETAAYISDFLLGLRPDRVIETACFDLKLQ